ncbi:MAG: ribosome maturation factor RimP [Deltaproteobacteria bacterium]|nr:ribosome maturation factor RimP [Deltaproteobacteria bacterium]
MNAQTVIERVRDLAEPILKSEGLELVEIQYRRERGGWVLRLFIDRGPNVDGLPHDVSTPSGVTIVDCAEASREIGRVLDVEEVITTSFTLEVSSPGLDRPLTKVTDFSRFAGRQVKVKIHAPEGRRSVIGKLLGLDGDLIKLEVQNEVLTIPYQHAERVRLEPEVPWKRN